MASLTDIAEEIRLAGRALGEFGAGLFNPTVRLGVTGLSRAGKTVFITALVHHLLHGGRLPVFEALASGRIARARLEPQPDDAVPRFDYETHVRALIEERRWPESTAGSASCASSSTIRRRAAARSHAHPRHRRLSGRVAARPAAARQRAMRNGRADTLALSRERPARRARRAHGTRISPTLDAGRRRKTRQAARAAARLFTDYLKACRDERYAMRLLPPGRFLMPGDLAGSPALTFAPLELSGDGAPPRGSLAAMMERRYEAYKDVVVRPFFREHFARLDRQIVLVDVLAALNAGPGRRAGPRSARSPRSSLASAPAATSWLSALFRPRIDRILFAATKADHLHHTDHDRLEALPRAHDRARRRARGIRRRDGRRRRARRGARDARGDGDARRATRCPRSSARRSRANASAARSSTARPRSPSFPGDLPDDPAALFTRTFAGLTSARRRRPISASCASARRRPKPGAERRTHPAAHPPRPCAAIPDRRPPRMSKPQARGAFAWTIRT